VTGVGAPILVAGHECEAAISAVWADGRDPAGAADAVMRSARTIAMALG
jgi:hypothetical protein